MEKKFIYNQGRDPGEPFFEHILQMVGVVGEEVLPRAAAQLKFSDSLLRGTTQAPPPPVSERPLFQTLSVLRPGPVGVPGSLTPWLGPPSLCLSSAVCLPPCGATGRVRLCCSNKYFTGFLTADLSFSAWATDGVHFPQSLVSSCSFVSSLPP